VAKPISLENNKHPTNIPNGGDESSLPSALQLYDSCGRLVGKCYHYLFYVTAESEAAALRVIAFGGRRRRFRPTTHVGGQRNNDGSLDETLPVTTEPIDPPSTMKSSVPEKTSLLVVNHSAQSMNLQIQMRLSDMTGVVVCGSSYVGLGEVAPSGGSCTVDVRLVALVAGLFSVRGCYIVDLLSGVELSQPALFDVFVKLPEEEGGVEEKKTTDVVDF